MAQGYLPRRRYIRICVIHTYHPSLCFFVASSLGFEISSAWTSSTEYSSAIASIFPQNWFGPKLKHAKGMDIVMVDIESLSSYPHYWKSCLLPHLLMGNFYRPAQPEHGWTFHQAAFCNSDLGGRTYGKQSLFFLTPPAMLLQPSPYKEIQKQPWNHMLASVNPVTSEVSKIQPAQPDNPEDQVYGSKAEVWPYGLFPEGYMGKRVQVPCVYNSPPWGIRQLTINDLDTLWDVPMLLQEKLEEFD